MQKILTNRILLFVLSIILIVVATPTLIASAQDAFNKKIEGKVKLADGTGVDGANVQLYRYPELTGGGTSPVPELYWGQNVQPDGSYSFTDLPDGKYFVKIAIVPDGYSLVSEPQSENYVLPSSELINFDFILKQKNGFEEGTVSGMVLDQDGNAVVASVVRLMKETDGMFVSDQGITIDDSGNYNFVSVSPGKYKVVLEWYPNMYTPDVKESKVFKIGAETPSYKQDFLLTNTPIVGRLSGHVYESNNQPVDGAEITLYRHEGDTEIEYASTTTDVAGYYEIKEIEAGNYTPRLTQLPDVFGQAELPVDGDRFDVDRGNESFSQDYTAFRPTDPPETFEGSIEVTITNQEGGELGGIEIQLINVITGSGNIPGGFEWNSTPADGHTLFHPLKPDTYQVSLNLEKYPDLNNPDDLVKTDIVIDASNPSASVKFTVNVPENELPPQGEVSCRITVEAETSMPGHPIKFEVHPTPASRINYMRVRPNINDLYYYDRGVFKGVLNYPKEGTYKVVAEVSQDQINWLASCETEIKIEPVQTPWQVRIFNQANHVWTAYLSSTITDTAQLAAAQSDYLRRLGEVSGSEAGISPSVYNWGRDPRYDRMTQVEVLAVPVSDESILNTQYGQTIYIDSRYWLKDEGVVIADASSASVNVWGTENPGSIYFWQHLASEVELPGPATGAIPGVQGGYDVGKYGYNNFPVEFNQPTPQYLVENSANAARLFQRITSFYGGSWGNSQVEADVANGSTSPLMDKTKPIEGIVGETYAVPPKISLVFGYWHNAGMYFDWFDEDNPSDQGRVEIAIDPNAPDKPWFIVQGSDGNYYNILTEDERQRIIDRSWNIQMDGHQVLPNPKAEAALVKAHVELMAKYEADYGTFSAHVVQLPKVWEEEIYQTYGVRPRGYNPYVVAYNRKAEAQEMTQEYQDALKGLARNYFRNHCTAETNRGLTVANEDILTPKDYFFSGAMDSNAENFPEMQTLLKLGPNLDWMEGSEHGWVNVVCPGMSETIRLYPRAEELELVTLNPWVLTDWDSEQLKSSVLEAKVLAEAKVAQANTELAVAKIGQQVADPAAVIEQEVKRTEQMLAVDDGQDLSDPNLYWTKKVESTVQQNGKHYDEFTGYNWEDCLANSCRYWELGITVHIVEAGQSLHDIAAGHGYESGSIVRLNGLDGNGGAPLVEGQPIFLGNADTTIPPEAFPENFNPDWAFVAAVSALN